MKKVPLSRLGQVDLPTGEVTFYSHLAIWARTQASCLTNKKNLLRESNI